MTAFIHPTATVEDGAVLGEGAKVWHQAQVRAAARVGVYCVLGKGSRRRHSSAAMLPPAEFEMTTADQPAAA